MPTVKLRLILAPLCALLVAVAVAGCGGDDDPEPSIPGASADTLLATLQEIEDNVDVGSCLIAADKIDDLRAELDALPASVNEEVSQALENGADQLSILVEDPDQCDRPEETTTEETTTEEDTTTEETTTEETTTEQTTTEETTTAPPTTTTTPPGGGGVGPPSGGDGL
jgi:hypothetical protein